MRHYGIPEQFISIIKTTYKGMTCRVVVAPPGVYLFFFLKREPQAVYRKNAPKLFSVAFSFEDGTTYVDIAVN